MTMSWLVGYHPTVSQIAAAVVHQIQIEKEGREGNVGKRRREEERNIVGRVIKVLGVVREGEDIRAVTVIDTNTGKTFY